MLENLLGHFIDKEEITHETIQKTLKKISTELNCSHEDFFIMIEPIDETFTMRFTIYKKEDGRPKKVRRITLKEILGS